MAITLQQLLALPNLTTGDTGADVQTLQQWLVENGYMTAADLATGPGTYGPKTTAAVAAWQSAAGFDTQGNPGSFGPLSHSFIQTNIASLTPAGVPNGTPPPTGGTGTGTGTGTGGTGTGTGTGGAGAGGTGTGTGGTGTGGTSNPTITLQQLASLPTLSPGSSGNDVATLQKWLVQNGFSIPSIANGSAQYGYYGPETQAAVAAWQQQAGFDTQGNPGYFGPISRQYIQTQIAAQGGTGTTTQPGTGTGTTVPTGGDTSTPPVDPAVLRALGLSDATIAAMNESQRAMFAAIGQAVQQQYDQNKSVPASFTADDLNRIMTEAQNSPDIQQYYKDQLRIGTEDFMRAFNMTSAEYSATASDRERQFTQDKENLQENAAAAGQAYSGFRGQANQTLNENNQSVIESSRRSLQRNLEGIGQNFERTYGSEALGALGLGTVDGVAYQPIGNISGSQAASATADIRDRYNELLNEEGLVRGLQ